MRKVIKSFLFVCLVAIALLIGSYTALPYLVKSSSHLIANQLQLDSLTIKDITHPTATDFKITFAASKQPVKLEHVSISLNYQLKQLLKGKINSATVKHLKLHYQQALTPEKTSQSITPTEIFQIIETLPLQLNALPINEVNLIGENSLDFKLPTSMINISKLYVKFSKTPSTTTGKINQSLKIIDQQLGKITGDIEFSTKLSNHLATVTIKPTQFRWIPALKELGNNLVKIDSNTINLTSKQTKKEFKIISQGKLSIDRSLNKSQQTRLHLKHNATVSIPNHLKTWEELQQQIKLHTDNHVKLDEQDPRTQIKGDISSQLKLADGKLLFNLKTSHLNVSMDKILLKTLKSLDEQIPLAKNKQTWRDLIQQKTQLKVSKKLLIEHLSLGKINLNIKAELSSSPAQMKLMPLRYKAELSSSPAQMKLMPLRYKSEKSNQHNWIAKPNISLFWAGHIKQFSQLIKNRFEPLKQHLNNQLFMDLLVNNETLGQISCQINLSSTINYPELSLSIMPDNNFQWIANTTQLKQAIKLPVEVQSWLQNPIQLKPTKGTIKVSLGDDKIKLRHKGAIKLSSKTAKNKQFFNINVANIHAKLIPQEHKSRLSRPAPQLSFSHNQLATAKAQIKVLSKLNSGSIKLPIQFKTIKTKIASNIQYHPSHINLNISPKSIVQVKNITYTEKKISTKIPKINLEFVKNSLIKFPLKKSVKGQVKLFIKTTPIQASLKLDQQTAQINTESNQLTVTIKNLDTSAKVNTQLNLNNVNFDFQKTQYITLKEMQLSLNNSQPLLSSPIINGHFQLSDLDWKKQQETPIAITNLNADGYFQLKQHRATSRVNLNQNNLSLGSIDAQYHLKNKQGNILLDLFNDFSTSQLSHKVEGLKELAEIDQGKIKLSGKINLNKNGVKPDNLTLSLNDLSGQVKAMGFNQLNTQVKFEKFSPLTLSKQQLTLNNLGDQFKINDLITFYQVNDINKIPTLTLDNFKVSLLDGQIKLQKASINQEISGSFPIEIHQIDATRLAQLLQQKGLYVKGKLNGKIPLKLIKKQSVIDNGSIISKNGILIYNAPDSMQQTLSQNPLTQIVVDALKNYHYTTLEAKINKKPGEKVKITTALKGINPQLYDGKRPIHMNIQLDVDDSIFIYALKDFTGKETAQTLLHVFYPQLFNQENK
ncbi:MAG: hypothetical protein HN826_00205 [Methylococcales bacterium]|jgi:hypothetical protein|nr:hypothetical protein [Methylococcales bacterium]